VTQPPIALPAEGAGLTVIASVSGGKDSTALILALREAEIPARYVFADTGWEAPETYAYLDYLCVMLKIAIDVVGVEGGMVARVRYRAGFPMRLGRWCTAELKMAPLRAYHDDVTASTGAETVSAIGVRADESAARAKMVEWVDEPDVKGSWGGYIWRPLLRWSVSDVLGMHNRHGVKVNPLYQRGHDRVGCYPCILSSKEDIALVARYSPERIDEIRALEAEQVAAKSARNEAEPGRYKNELATFFQTSDGSGIDRVVEWARTNRGGRQLPLLAPPPKGGCMRWGICDLPPGKDAVDGDADE